MRYFFLPLLLVVLVSCKSVSRVSQDKAGAGIAAAAMKSSKLDTGKFQKNAHPDAQWFQDAGLGLFIHWGIHSVGAVQPSWGMVKDYEWNLKRDYEGLEKYYSLARDFDPKNYDPEKWVRAAARAGFKYIVLTTKHHDGFTLWPSKYGEWNTSTFMDGRDLLLPYVEACRKYGLKVGFYFSPRDWSYPGYPPDFDDFNARKPHRPDPSLDSAKAREDFEKFYLYTMGQMRELLTNYGKIDLLWFDGVNWDGVTDIRLEETANFIRALQPSAIINDRWGGKGDFRTVEWTLDSKPDLQGWWEYCISWKGHWGYSPDEPFRPLDWFFKVLATVRSQGGNFLLNIGPSPDGEMPAGYYPRMDSISSWMASYQAAVLGDLDHSHKADANVPVTIKKNLWYCHVVDPGTKEIRIKGITRTPKSVYRMDNGHPVDFVVDQDSMVVNVAAQPCNPLDEVFVIEF